jgi:hypothetical protein
MIAHLVALALQGPLVDAGTLLIRHDTVEVGREAFRLAAGRPGAGGAGWTLATRARYDRARPVVELAPILEIGRDSSVVTLQYDVSDPREPVRILGEAGRSRFTVRVLAPHSERAREFPADARLVVLDDSVFALYLLVAWRARSDPVTLEAVVPRALRRETLTVQAHGPAATTLNRAAVTLTLVTVQGGRNRLVRAWLDSAGRLMKIAIPSRRVTVERVPEG